MRVAVVGAGWAGLAAAVDLTAGGAEVSVFEAGRAPGGRARSVALDGRALDNGQHILLGAYRDCLALMREVGANPEELLQRRPLAVRDRQGFSLTLPRWPAPLNVAWGLFAARGVGWREKIATACWMDRLKRREFCVDGDPTVAEWLAAAGQTGTLRRHLWAPLCLAALNTPIERASARIFANVLRDSLGSPRREDTDLLLPAAPLGELFPQPACAWLAARGARLHFSRRVRSLVAGPDGITIDGEHFAAAVLAVAPQHLGALWPEAGRPLAFEPIATVWLDYGPGTRLDFPLLHLGTTVGQWVIDRGQGLLAAVQSGDGGWATLDDSTLAAALIAELDLGTPRWQRVVREKRATFSCRPQMNRAGMATRHPHLVLAGDHVWQAYPATLEGAVRSGRAAARALLGSQVSRNAA